MAMMIPWRRAQDVTPWQEMERLGERMRAMLDPEVRQGWMSPGEPWPAIELVEGEGEFVLSAELPGISMEDLDISVQEGVLSLSGEKKSEKDEERGTTHIRERFYGRFERSFTLPPTVKQDDIHAEFKDGVVKIRMPKSQESQGRRIEIQS